jgi:hypothetical protein
MSAAGASRRQPFKPRIRMVPRIPFERTLRRSLNEFSAPRMAVFNASALRNQPSLHRLFRNMSPDQTGRIKHGR